LAGSFSGLGLALAGLGWAGLGPKKFPGDFLCIFFELPGSFPDWAWLAENRQPDVFTCSVIYFVWDFWFNKHKGYFDEKKSKFIAGQEYVSDILCFRI